MNVMDRILRIEARPPYRLYVEFEDGLRGEYDMTDRLNGPVFEQLKDPAFFAQVHLDEYGVPVWPNGTDIAPDALHDRIAGQGRPPCTSGT
jgi:Protein of unknown function (DUF2442)